MNQATKAVIDSVEAIKRIEKAEQEKAIESLIDLYKAMGDKPLSDKIDIANKMRKEQK